MESALAWVGAIFDWLGKWIPRWTVLDTTEGAVKYIGSFWSEGVTTVACGPGVHWYWPVTTLWQMYPTARQTDNLPTQTFCTKDDKVIAVGGMLIYAVDDIVKLVTTTHSPMMAVQDIALTSIHDVCCNLTWEELKDEQRRGTLDTKLKNTVQRQLADYGVRVLKCMLTDLAPTRVLKVIQSVNHEAA